jgi:hypothetical protein
LTGSRLDTGERAGAGVDDVLGAVILPFFAAVSAAIIVWLLIRGDRRFVRLYPNIFARIAEFITPAADSEIGGTS